MTLPSEHSAHPRRDPAEELELARVRVDLAARVADVTRLGDLGAAATRTAGLDAIQAVLRDLLEAMARMVDADAGVLHIYDPRQDELFARVSTERAGSTEHWPVVGRAEGPAGRALEALAAVTEQSDDPDARFGTTLAVPMLTLAREPMGVVSLLFHASARLDVGRQALVAAYADQAAELVERVRLHSEAHSQKLAERLRAEQLQRLAAAADELMGQLDLDGLLRTVTEAARTVVGSHQAVTSRLVRGWTEAFTHVSLSERYSRWRTYDRVPKGLGVLNYVTRENRSLRLTGKELVRHPDWRGMQDAPDHPPLPNYLAAPLIGRDGRNLGLIQLSDKDVGEGVGDFTAEDEVVLNLLARLASAAVEDMELRERERVAGQRVDVSARSLKLLADASRALAETLEVDATLETITSLAVPVLGDWCGVHLLDEGGRPELAAHAGVEPVFERALADVADGASGGDGIDVGGVLSARETDRRSELPEAMLRALQEAFPERALEPGTLLVVPLAAHGRDLGTLTLVRVPGPPYTEGEADLAEELGRRAALAVDNARRYAGERDTALVLQRSMLPEIRREAAGLRVASRYLPGAEGLNVGGDWYDLVDLGERRHGVVIGDVAGRGIAAASVMGQLRAAVRAYALEGHPPGRLLDQLDAFVLSQRPVVFVTCLYAVVDEQARTLTVASAGHPPPLVIDGDEERLLDIHTGPPLGAAPSAFRETTVSLGADATVLLYTDGLVERRGRSIDEGLELLRSAARRWRHSPEALCDGVLLTMSESRRLEDDTALIAVSVSRPVEPAGPEERLVIELASEPASAGRARRRVAEVLHERGAGAQVGASELLVTEVVANAIRHAGGRRIEVSVEVHDAAVRVDVVDEGSSEPIPGMPPGAEDAGGRGLMIVEALAARWGYEPDAGGGKRVWFELDRGS